ncbi:unnamed protein product, partial [Brugia pahangi]|uniref:MCM_N domain-containing protein n=1 Tax=Brugia pahangi TaxID=6280 RepID=A0A0N4TGN2_BRUPA
MYSGVVLESNDDEEKEVELRGGHCISQSPLGQDDKRRDKGIYDDTLSGKRRILQILLDLKAYEMEFDYQTIRDEYMKRYSTSLNAAEHQRLFMNKSALKNFLRVFYREVILIDDSPIRVRLRSPDIK